jgi:hypothetical protein
MSNWLSHYCGVVWSPSFGKLDNDLFGNGMEMKICMVMEFYFDIVGFKEQMKTY